MRRLEPAEQLASTMQALASSGLVELEVAVAGVLAVFKANFRAMAVYRPSGYDGPMTVFRTEDGFPEEYFDHETGRALEDRALGWSAFVTGPLEVEMLAGDHLGMLDADRLPALTARLRGSIEAALPHPQPAELGPNVRSGAGNPAPTNSRRNTGARRRGRDNSGLPRPEGSTRHPPSPFGTVARA